MGKLVLAAAGAVVGSFFGMPMLGAQIGLALGGGMEGGKTTHQVNEGPKIEDLRITGTETGQMIPWVSGVSRVAGQIWWASLRRPVTHHSYSVQETGGKGGGGGSTVTDTVTTTYDVDLLIGLADNLIDGVGRIWEDGNLIVAPGQDAGRWDRATVYPGSTDQLPDPVYEAAVGADRALAYRGRAYVFIEGYHLGQSPAMVRNLTFEVFANGILSGFVSTSITGTWNPFPTNGLQIFGFGIGGYVSHTFSYSTDGGGDLTSLVIHDISTTEGDFVISGSTGFESLISSHVRIDTNLLLESTVLSAVSMPRLEFVGNSFSIDSNVEIDFNFPRLREVGGTFSPINPPFTTGFNVIQTWPAVNSVGAFSAYNYADLEELYLPHLTVCLDDFYIDFARSLTVLSIPNLRTIGGDFYLNAFNNPVTNLVSFTFPPGLMELGGDVYVQAPNLNQPSVVGILVRLAAMNGTGGTTSYDGHTIEIHGGATLNAAGLAAKATLEGRGNTVTVD